MMPAETSWTPGPVLGQFPLEHRGADSTTATPAMDADCFDSMVNRHISVVRGLLHNMLRHQADAEDALQETLLQAFSHFRQLRTASSFRPWLLQIAINEARKLLRLRAARRQDRSIDPPTDERDSPPREVADRRENPAEAWERRELHEFVRRKMAQLPGAYRDVLLLCDVENANTETAAKLLGVSKARVRTTLYRARARLREDLAPVSTP